MTGGLAAVLLLYRRCTARPQVKVVANLPYNITKELLVLLLPLGDVVSELHIMIQHEVAERLTQRTPGTPDWRSMNVRTLFFCRPKCAAAVLSFPGPCGAPGGQRQTGRRLRSGKEAER